MKRSTLTALLAALGFASCTIYGLSDEIHQGQCTWELNLTDDCEALNDRTDPSFDRCNIWRCGDKQLCEVAPLDQDRDGFSPPLCLPSGQQGDCDDGDAAKHPGLIEMCDGKDNDCDDSIDEGMLQRVDHVAVVLDDEVGELAYAWGDVTHDVAVTFRRTGDGQSGVALITSEKATKGQPLWLSLTSEVFNAASVNVAPRSGGFVLGVIEGVPTQRMWVGNVANAGDHFVLNVDESNHRRTGLRCASDEPCAAEQGPRDDSPEWTPAALDLPTPMIPASTEPELAALGSQLLVGYARGPDGAFDGCDPDAPTAPLLLNLLEPTADGWNERTEDAIVLDTSRESRAPRLLPIDAKLITAARGPFGWLAAYIDAEGGLVVRRVRPGAAADEIRDLRLRLVGDPEPYFEPQIVIGPVEDRIFIGVAARAGCAEKARVVFGVLQLTWDASGETDLRVYRELHEVGNGQQASRPVLAFNRAVSNWGIAYETPDGIFARLLDRNGQAVGPSAYRMTNAPPYAPDVAIVSGAPAEATMFTVYTYEEQPDQTPSHTVIAHELQTCRDVTTLSESR